MELLAKSEKNGNKKETLREHTNHCLDSFNQLITIYPNALTDKEKQFLQFIVEHHDIGKANTKFQNKVNNEIKIVDSIPFEEIPHNYLSPAFIDLDYLEDHFEEWEVNVILSAIYYHHEREERIENIETYIKKDLAKFIPHLEKDGFSVRKNPKKDYFRYVDKEELAMDSTTFLSFVKLKGLLNRVDYSASGHYPIEENLEDISLIIKNRYSLNDLQTYLFNQQEENVVIIGSTGIGKTEGALCWIGNNKGIFTLPLKVSINAIYKRIKKDYSYEGVGIVHSDSIFEYVNEWKENPTIQQEELDLTQYRLSRSFSKPLTITTIDQIIDFVVMYPGFEWKLATLAYSKLVIDEIQMYDPKLFAYIVIGLKWITQMGGKFLIMTATLPPVLIHFLNELEIPFQIPENPFYKLTEQGKTITRHVIDIQTKDLTMEEIVKQDLSKRVLIIVNTVSKAQQLYTELKDKHLNVNVLHSRFTKEDRATKESAIYIDGKVSQTKNCIWITTQIVEASIDIDFDLLITELSEVNGLFQRMGRVYRNRIYTDATPNVFVYTGKENPSGISSINTKSVVDFHIYQKSKDILLQYNQQLITEEMKMEIVETVYSIESLEGSDYLKKINEEINQLKHLLPYHEKIKPKLRDIKNVSIIPTSIFVMSEDWIVNGLTNFKKMSTSDKLQFQLKLKELTVDIPMWAFENAKRKGEIYFNAKINNYISYPVINYQYSMELGLEYKLDEESMFF